MTGEELYEIYNRTVGRLRSGTKLTNGDYGQRTPMGLHPYEEDGKAAVTIASDDVATKAPTRTKAELVAEIKRRLG